VRRRTLSRHPGRAKYRNPLQKRFEFPVWKPAENPARHFDFRPEQRNFDWLQVKPSGRSDGADDGKK